MLAWGGGCGAMNGAAAAGLPLRGSPKQSQLKGRMSPAAMAASPSRYVGNCSRTPSSSLMRLLRTWGQAGGQGGRV